jgi:regulator of protease activity HflC (stomatin/prohibitin superfamily)
MTYEECIGEYGTTNEDYCSQFESSGETPLDFANNFIGSIFSNIALLALIVFLIVILALSIKIIRQKTEAVVERLGRYNRTLKPGLRLVFPLIERIADRVDLMQYQLSVETSVKTNDEQMVKLPVAVMVKVIDSSASIYEVDEPDDAITALISNEVKAKAAGMSLQEIFDDRESIRSTVTEHLTVKINTWGFDVTEVVIDNPKLTPEMEAAYNSVAAAERSKQAATAAGEALKIKKVAEAVANGESLKISGQAYVAMRDMIAKGNAAAINEMKKDTDLTDSEIMTFLTTIDANDAVRDAAASGATVVVATGRADHATMAMVAQNAK